MSQSQSKLYSKYVELKSLDPKVPKIDFSEVLARMVQDTLWNGMHFGAKKDAPQEWKEFAQNITDNNPYLFLKMKGMEKFLSKTGTGYAIFELWNGKILIDIALPSERNQYTRISQGIGFNAIVERDYLNTKNTPPFRVVESYTTSDVDRLVLTVPGVKQIPIDIFLVNLPPYIQEKYKIGVQRHDYGVLPVKEFLNKNIVDFDFNEINLSDTAPVYSFIPKINEFLFEFVCDEWKLDTTKLIGELSWQDQVVNKTHKPSAAQITKLMNTGGIYDEPWYKLGTGNLSSTEYIRQKLIVNTQGSNNKIEKMQTTYDGVRHMEALRSMIQLAFQMSGYDFDKADGSQSYANTASVLNVNKNVYQTTRMKKTQREEDWKEFFERMSVVYFNKVKGKTIEEARIEAKNIYKWIDFEISSNLLNDYMKNDERIIALRTNRLMTLHYAIESLYPNKTEEEINLMVEELQKESEKDENALFGKGQEMLKDQETELVEEKEETKE